MGNEQYDLTVTRRRGAPAMTNWFGPCFYMALLSLFAVAAWGQDPVNEKKLQAKEFLLHERYAEALTTLRNLRRDGQEDKESHLLRAIAHYHLNQLNEAEALLKEHIDREKAPYPEAWLFLGKIYHARHEFVRAADAYKQGLRLLPGGHPNRALALDDIRRCANGMRWQYRDGQAFVENLGAEVNTPYDEFGAVPSQSFSDRLYFSSRRPGNVGGARDRFGRIDERLGQYYADIYSARNRAGVWTEVAPLSFLLNSPRHEAVLDFNGSGTVMYYYQGADWHNGTIMVDTFRQAEERVLSSDPFAGPVDPAIDQAAPHFVNATTVIFASRQLGGFGGLDLYITTYRNGRWSTPKNLGPKINSPYDETSPFLARDDKTLFFSSNDSRRSIGGFDVFKSQYLPEQDAWSEPVNMGIPINSAGDDTHFRLSNDGFSAFLTSNRKDGYGQRDIYVAYFNDFLPEQEPPALGQATFLSQFPEIAVTPAPRPSHPLGPERGAPGQASTPASAAPLKHLFFDTPRALLAGDNLTALDQVADIMRAQPRLRLVLTAHAPKGGMLIEKAFDAIQHAELAAEYLIKKGAPASRLLLRGVTSDLNAAGMPFSHAIDLQFTPCDPLDRHLFLQPLPVRPNRRDNLFYSVRIAVSAAKFSDETFERFPDLAVEKQPDSRAYHIYTGYFRLFAEADKWRRDLAVQGVTTAQVAPYVDGWRANQTLARESSGLYPDLINYLESNKN
jgi:tetratricopeptide (TPR) repeat protein